MWFSKKCPQCRSKIKKRVFYKNRDVFSYLLLYFILEVGVIGCIIFIIFVPVVGWVLGSFLLIFIIWVGSKTRGAWICKTCGYTDV